MCTRRQLPGATAACLVTLGILLATESAASGAGKRAEQGRQVDGGHVHELTPDDFDRVVSGSQHALVLFYADWCGHCKAIASDYKAVADTYSDPKIKDTIIAQIDADLYRAIGSRYNIAGYPTIVYFPKGNKENWEVYTGERIAHRMVKYMNSMTGHKAVYVKPHTATVTLDDDNFASIVHDSKKHVLVKFYAPWCAHCKHLAPGYELVAQAFRREPKVIVGKYDADWNKVYGQQFSITMYPTIKLFSPDNKSGLMYEGARDPESMISFVNSKVGTARNIDGSLKPESAILATMGEHIQDFLKKDKENGQLSERAIQAAARATESLHGIFAENGKVYIKVMHKVKELGVGYLDQEANRLDRSRAFLFLLEPP
jgi:protein disulfide-isomerase A6